MSTGEGPGVRDSFMKEGPYGIGSMMIRLESSPNKAKALDTAQCLKQGELGGRAQQASGMLTGTDDSWALIQTNLSF